ncbi:hypothetical protein CIB84_007637 [Bambusicola thoracicus]|uniref:Uncharacterized protein n=1 Tax=Bambusicola thoracicus TaxID=9083 RepID=A0A2P4SWY8_BAMTH|nr:hypothetical protein CIB84_007637 [Bambusicola thoracicus]
MWDLTRTRKKKKGKKKKKKRNLGLAKRPARPGRSPPCSSPDGAPPRPPLQRKGVVGTLRRPPRSRPSGGGAYGLVPRRRARRAMELLNTDPRGRLPSAASRPVRRRGVPSRRRGVTERTGWGRGDSQHGSPLCSPLLPRRAAASGSPERVFMWQQMGAARSEQHHGARAGAAPSVYPAPGGSLRPRSADGPRRGGPLQPRPFPEQNIHQSENPGAVQGSSNLAQRAVEPPEREEAERPLLSCRYQSVLTSIKEGGERSLQGCLGQTGARRRDSPAPPGMLDPQEFIGSLFPRLLHSVRLSIIWICVTEIRYLRAGRSRSKEAKGSSPAPTFPPHLYFDSPHGA